MDAFSRGLFGCKRLSHQQSAYMLVRSINNVFTICPIRFAMLTQWFNCGLCCRLRMNQHRRLRRNTQNSLLTSPPWRRYASEKCSVLLLCRMLPRWVPKPYLPIRSTYPTTSCPSEFRLKYHNIISYLSVFRCRFKPGDTDILFRLRHSACFYMDSTDAPIRMDEGLPWNPRFWIVAYCLIVI